VREERGLRAEIRLVEICSDPESQASVYPTGKAIPFVTTCFLCRMIGGALRTDGIETLEAAFFEPNQPPADLLPMRPCRLSDALSQESRRLRKVAERRRPTEVVVK
jgi:hypothetical protein